MQVGTPYEIYYKPRNLFVANFMSEINYFEGVCAKNTKPNWDIHKKSKQKDQFYEEIQKNSVPMPISLENHELFAAYIDQTDFNKIQEQEKLLLVVRANHMKIRAGNKTNEKHNALAGKIVRRKFMGVFYRFEVLVKFNGTEKIIIVTNPATSEIHNTFVEGLEVTVYFPKELGIVFKHPGQDEIKKILKLQ